MPANALSERAVVEIWQNCLASRADLVTEEGVPIRVIYPGRLNDDRGADLLDAVIFTGQGSVRGDIEVHVKSSSWWAHQHHRDPVYNRVILHVVYWHDTETATNLQNGHKVPTLELRKFIENQINQGENPAYPSGYWSLPCRSTVNRWNTSIMGGILDTAGEARFLAKAANYRAALTQTEASQVLYQGIMEALGYAKNKHQLLKLAHRMPLYRLESVASRKISDSECLAQQQALLMGTAGLLPSQRSRQYRAVTPYDAWVDKLERAWATSREMVTMSEDDWHLFKVRPSNYPARRIVAMSYLLLRYRERGILKELVNRLCQETIDMCCRRLERALQVTADGYWARYLDFGLPGRDGLPALLGGGRAADIVVNVLIPFTAAWSQLNSRQELARKALELYRHYPRLAINTVERHMRNQLGINRYLVNSAQRQQGLIHIYKTLCSQGKCDSCPIGGAEY
jgi:hypothetical protein